MAEQIIDTFVPELVGFETKIENEAAFPFTLLTEGGILFINSSKISIPSFIYTYATERDTYDDVIRIRHKLGIGDGISKTFETSLVPPIFPILPSTIYITDGQSVIYDISNNQLDPEHVNFVASYNGYGTLIGDGDGSINYENGLISAVFDIAPAAGVDVIINFVVVQHSAVALGSLSPTRPQSSTRLQKIVTDDVGIASITKLAKTDWDRHIFIAGRALQSREANEIVSMLEYFNQQLGNTLFKDGNIVSGCQIVINPDVIVEGVTKLSVTVTDGKVYVAGKIREITGTSFEIFKTGSHILGIRAIPYFITENQDSSLKDPATGFDGSGLEGAYRQAIRLQWRLNDSNSVTVFRVKEGTILNQERPTVFGNLERLLARRTFDESGNYKVTGFALSTAVIPENDHELELDIQAGLAYVEGFEINKPSAIKVRWRKAIDTNAVVNEQFQYKPLGFPTKEIYMLANTPIASVTSVSAIVRSPLMVITSNNTAGGTTDNLSSQSTEQGNTAIVGTYYSSIPGVSSEARILLYSSPAAANADVNGNAPTYVEGVNFSRSAGDTILWTAGAPGSHSATLYGFWNYNSENGYSPLKKGTRLRTQVTPDESRTFTAVAVWENLANVDIDASAIVVYTDSSGNPPNKVFIKGVDYRVRNGRTATGVGFGQIRWIKSGQHPTGTYFVKYSYWSHSVALWSDSAEGDYVSPDSYLEIVSEGSIQFPGSLTKYRVPFELIPNKGPSEDALNGIDFRPGGKVLATQTNGIGYNVTLTYNYFLPRIDTIVVDQLGDIKIIYGEPSPSPKLPVARPTLLRLGHLSSAPNSNNPAIREATTVRSTMDDIQSIKLRLDSVELNFSEYSLTKEARDLAPTFAIRGLFTDDYTNFDLMDLAYDRFTDLPDPAQWTLNTVMKIRDVRKSTSPASFYFGVIAVQGDAKTSGTEPTWPVAEGLTVVDGNVTWVAIPKTEHVVHEIAIGNLAHRVGFPVVLTAPQEFVHNKIDFDSSTVSFGNSLITLPYVHEAEINQPYATEVALINPYNAFDPVMNTLLEPSADLWINTEIEPRLIAPLPGGPNNITIDYRGANNNSVTVSAGAESVPIGSLPPKALESIDLWWAMFHSGIQIDTVNVPLTFAAGVDYEVNAEGNLAVSDESALGNVVELTNPDLLGYGFMPRNLNVVANTQFQRFGDVVRSTALVMFVRPQLVKIVGNLYPVNVDISATFGGIAVSLTPVESSGTVVGVNSGTVRVVSDITDPKYGSFQATFMIPNGIPIGVTQVAITAGDHTRRVAYVTLEGA